MPRIPLFSFRIVQLIDPFNYIFQIYFLLELEKEVNEFLRPREER